MPRANDYQINIRTNKERYMYLHEIENYSQYLNDLIDKDRLRKRDNKFIDQQIEGYEQLIKELKETKKASKVDTSKVNEILNKHYESFKQNNRAEYEPKWNRDWIKREIIPELKPLGCKLNEDEILGLFQDHVREGKVLINEW